MKEIKYYISKCDREKTYRHKHILTEQLLGGLSKKSQLKPNVYCVS